MSKVKKTDIPNDTITYAKMQNASADNVILGNVSGVGKPIAELTAAQVAGIVDGELLVDEDDFASDTDTKAPTQQSAKAYVDAAVAAVPTPDVVLISTQTASGSSSINFTGLSSTYSKYEVLFHDVVPSSDTNFLRMRTSSDNGSSYDSGASDYYILFHGADGGAVDRFDAAAAQILINYNPLGTASNELLNGKIIIYNPSASEYTFVRAEICHRDNAGVLCIGNAAGVRQSAAAVNAISFFMSSNNIASGTFKLYGYK